MIEQGLDLMNEKKLGVNSQGCKFYSSIKCVKIGKQQEGR